MNGDQIAKGVGGSYVLFGPVGVIIGNEMRNKASKTIELAIDSDLDPYKMTIVNLINRLRKSIDCPELSGNEVTTNSSYVHKIVYKIVSLGKKWVDKHKPVTIISIPVVKIGYDPTQSKIYSKWLKDMEEICHDITFSETRTIVEVYKIYAEYNPSKFSIDINFST